MERAFKKYEIEKMIRNKLSQQIDKRSFDMYMAYLNVRHMDCLEEGNNEEADKYFKLMQAVEGNYNKSKKPFELDENKQIGYIND